MSRWFGTRVQDWWNHFEVDGHASFMIIRKLGLLKEELKKWNKEVFGDVTV